jgi:hypothetical protein
MGLLDDITDALGGGAAGKISELVDDLWGDRKKILELVDTLWDKRDEVLGAIGWVRDHGDEVVELVGALPQRLGQAGDGLEDAGDAVRRASTFLTSEGNGVSVADLTGSAATALTRAEQQIRSASDVFAKLGDQFDSRRSVAASRASRRRSPPGRSRGGRPSPGRPRRSRSASRRRRRRRPRG